MKIKTINGNLLDATEKYIVHQVNCQGVMGSGLAKEIKDKYPDVYNAYHTLCNGVDKRELLGFSQFVDINENRTIINLFGQFKYGIDKRHTSYDAVYDGLIYIRNKCKDKLELAFPYKMSSDRGGADWDVILQMINSVFKDTDFSITIYKL